jgi:hypothetical protein
VNTLATPSPGTSAEGESKSCSCALLCTGPTPTRLPRTATTRWTRQEMRVLLGAGGCACMRVPATRLSPVRVPATRWSRGPSRKCFCVPLCRSGACPCALSAESKRTSMHVRRKGRDRQTEGRAARGIEGKAFPDEIRESLGGLEKRAASRTGAPVPVACVRCNRAADSSVPQLQVQ